jgi:hypothetical protein
MNNSQSKVWDTLIEIQKLLENSFDETGIEVFEPGMDRFNQPGWVNRVWTSESYRRAHVDVVDARESKGLWMMHCCIFPHIHNPAPIYGFDVIAGKNKITGCFHDYSKAGDADHPMMQWFHDEVAKLEWNTAKPFNHLVIDNFLPEDLANGKINIIQAWLQKEIYCNGRYYSSEELCKKATGDTLQSSYFIDYATKKFAEIYELDSAKPADWTPEFLSKYKIYLEEQEKLA